MSWKTINNTGYFLEKSRLPQEKGMRKASAFLHQMTEEFGRNCGKYFDMVKDLPFAYRERQVHSMLLPSIAKISQAAFVEQPVSRKNNGNSQHGWIDYWVYYESFVFLIELKHGWHTLYSQNVRTKTQQGWKKGIEQIKSISKLEAKSIGLDPNKMLKMALMIVPHYQDSSKINHLTSLDKLKVTNAHNFLVNNLSPTPNWNSLWALNKRLQEVRSFKNSWNEIYPSVSFVAKVESL